VQLKGWRDVKRLCAILLLVSAQATAAEEARFHIEGEKLFYNSSAPYPGGNETDIIDKDIDELGLYLMEAPDVTTVVLKSWGGHPDVAMAMGDKIADLNLATEVQHHCESACPLIFLAGRPRTLVAGGQLGFHRSSTSTKYVIEFVISEEEWTGEIVDPAVAAYDQAVTSSVGEMQYMLRHGVSEAFILETLATPPREMLRPNREALIAAGVIDAN
jgi:hypothetical protein